MKVVFAADHAGFELKNTLVAYAQELGYEVEDFGAHEYDEQDDYPPIIAKAAEAVSEEAETVRGVIIGGSGQGEAIVANRFPGVRAVVFNGQYAPEDGREVPDELAVTREHNNANMLSLGARFLSVEEAKDAMRRWLEIPFSGEIRHARRIGEIEELG